MSLEREPKPDPYRHCGTNLSRREFLRAAAGVVALSGVSGSALACSAEPTSTVAEYHWFLSSEELARIQRGIDDANRPWIGTAHTRVRAEADRAREESPQPADPGLDYREKEMWDPHIQAQGRRDGKSALSAAITFRLTADERYAEAARKFCLAWARVYNPPATTVGHMVAEPAGPCIKLFWAFDLAKEAFAPEQASDFREWAGLFIPVGQTRTDRCRDEPWVPDGTYGGQRANVTTVGNSANWSRALAVTAAAVVGREHALDFLDWNWAHDTPAGNEFGWHYLLDAMYIGATGETVEGRHRHSLAYGAWNPYILTIIADVARHLDHERDLLAPTAAGTRLLQWATFYEPYFTAKRPYPYDDQEEFFSPADWDGEEERQELRRGGQKVGHSEETVASMYRAASEVAANLQPDPDLRALFEAMTRHRGPEERARNYDPISYTWAALLGGARGTDSHRR